MHPTHDLIAFHEKLRRCVAVEEVFGDLGGTFDGQEAALRTIYRNLVARYHPDRHRQAGPDISACAEEVIRALNALRAEAEARIRQGIYGLSAHAASPTQDEIVTRHHVYRVLRPLLEGDYASLYLGSYDDADEGPDRRVVIKIVSDTRNNDLMQGEATVLRGVRHKSMPEIVESFRSRDGRRANVLGWLEGVDGYTLRSQFPEGVALEHVTWIMERLLSVLGHLHVHRVIHANIEPGNFIVRPRDHNVFLIDYVLSVSEPGHDSRFKGATPHFSAPEVLGDGPPVPSSDMYSLGMCMLFLLGGDPATGRLPAGLDQRFAAFLREMLEPHPVRRASDAWQSHRRLSDLRKAMFGARHQFIPLPTG